MIKVIKYLFSSRSIPIIICTSLMLFFLGLYFLIAFKSNAFVNSLKNESNLLIELKPQSTQEQKAELKSKLTLETGILITSIEFISSEEAKKIMAKELGSGFIDLADENPFLDVFQLKVDNSKTEVDKLLLKIKEETIVQNAYAQNSYVEEIAVNVRKFSRLALIVGIFFSILAITLIFNAIKLSLVESKSSFYTLKMLGSDWNFIKRPFLQRAFYSGLLSGGISILLFVITITFVILSNNIFRSIIGIGTFVLVALFMLLVGFFVNLISTNIILNKYLAMQEEDLYN